MKKLFLTLLCLGVAVMAYSQEIIIDGDIAHTLKLSAATIASLKHENATLVDHDGKAHIYSGVPISALLDSAGAPLGKSLKGEQLSRYVLIQCADGYKVLFSLAELDDSLTGRLIILADHVDGNPLPSDRGPFRLVVPGETKPARSCYQVQRMSIHLVKE
jgi:DMSO/TMAO reductase YedYZ molybdopterin-dependent catalytic subunit